MECPAGFYCDQVALSKANMESNKKCPPGKFCEEATAVPADCAKGRWCGAGSESISDDVHGMFKL